uniref:Uncharacterized protein n=1 Tax=Canis lupus familiaris TaxID=9615 RepID=A0A8C0SVE3_CANLF
MRSQDDHQYIAQELLVLGIHVQLVTVQLTKLSKGALEIVHVLNSISKGSQHFLAMGLDLGVTHYGRSRGKVAKVVKESLGPGVNNQDQCLPAQGLASSIFHIHFAPQAGDSSLLLGTKMHHDVRSESLQAIRDRSRYVLLSNSEIDEWVG